MDKPLRVLMVTSEWPGPGQSKTAHFVKRQADFLRAAGVDVEVFAFYSAKNPFNYARAWARLRLKLRRERYDLVHAQFGQSGLVALPKRLPLVVTFRGSDLLGIVGERSGRYTRLSGIQQRVSRLVARRADARIVVSEHMKQNLPPGADAHVIPSGIDFELFKPMAKDEARRRLDLPADEPLILFVGRPSQARKRFDLAERAVAVLNETTPARLVVAWQVAHTDVPLYMSASDALVFTSMQEGSPNVVKEALACDLPVVSVAVGDVEERLRGIEGCELCADERPETIAAALRKVLARGVRVRGREAVAHLDENLITARVIDIYRSVLAIQRVSEQTQLMSRVSQAGR
ncbi:MAG TPA: glycosyltransferase family 4 protein [Pyrinomonadaceae bacterium]|jgi:glycosyltransferase involved in cell wall biosynthesis